MKQKDVVRFLRKVNFETICWPWRGRISPDGYGVFDVNLSYELAHRISYEIHKGPIPKGLTIDHLCRVRACVNPEHLEAVPVKVNVLRGKGIAAINAKKAKCKNGHSLANAIVSIISGRIRRMCRECNRLRRAWHHKTGSTIGWEVQL